MPSTNETLADLISHTVTPLTASHTAMEDPAKLAVAVMAGYVLRTEVLFWPIEKAFELLGKVPGLQAKAPRYVIFVGAASGGALLYFLLHDAADLSTGAHVAIMLAFACPLTMLVYAVMTCSRGEDADEAEARGLSFNAVAGRGDQYVGTGDNFDQRRRSIVHQWDAKKKKYVRQTLGPDSAGDNFEEGGTRWASACKVSGYSPCKAALVAAAKLVLWHWLQPVAYLFALVVYWGEIDTNSRWLGAIVGVREAIYLVSTIVALFVQPAYLLVSTRATLRDEKGVGHQRTIGPAGCALMLIFMPEQFVMLSLRPLVGQPFANRVSSHVLPALSSGAIAALMERLLPGSFRGPYVPHAVPPPLLVGYALTALGCVTWVLLRVDFMTCRCTERLSKALL